MTPREIDRQMCQIGDEIGDETIVHGIEPRHTLFYPTPALWLEMEGPVGGALWDACASAYEGSGPPVRVVSRTFKTGRDGRYDVARRRVAVVLEHVSADADDEAARAIEDQFTPDVWAHIKGRAIADIALWFQRHDGYSATRNAWPVSYRLSAVLEGAAAPATFDRVGPILDRWGTRLERGAERQMAQLRAYADVCAARYRRALDARPGVVELQKGRGR